jgi:hypothetical protein
MRKYMIIEGQYKENDYVQAQYLHLRPSPVFTVIGLLLLALFIWAMFHGASFILIALSNIFLFTHAA